MVATPVSFQSSPQIDGPAYDGVAITPADADLANPVRFLYVGSIAGGAVVKITTLGGSVLTFTGLSAGIIIPFSAKRVWATDTTASNIVGGF